MPISLLQLSGERLLPLHVDDELSSRPQRAVEVAQHLQVVIGIFEVAERTVEVEGAVEGVWALETPHVGANGFDVQLQLGGPRTEFFQISLGQIDARDRVAAPRELERVAARPATKVEHRRAGLEPEQSDDLVDLCGGGFGGEDVGKEKLPKIFPEAVFFVPGAHFNSTD